MFKIFRPKGQTQKQKKSVPSRARLATPRIEPSASPTLSPPPFDKVVREFGGPSGAEPTRYGDWERKGRCIDF